MAFKKADILSVIVLLITVGLAGNIRAGGFDSTLVLEDLIQEGLQTNPELRAASGNVHVFRSIAPQSSSLPDPQLTFGVLNLPTDNFNFTQEPMTQKAIGLSQQFPFFGKLGLQERVADEDTGIEQLRYSRLRLDLINRIKQVYFWMWYLEKSLAITSENLVILADLAAVTEAKYRVGKGFQQDLLKTQLEELHLQQEKYDIEEKISNKRSELNILLNRMPQAPLGKPEERSLPRLGIALDSLQKLALANNPDLQIRTAVIRKMTWQMDLAEKDYWPDFRLAVNYGQRTDRPDFLSGLITVNLPLYAGRKQSERLQQYRLSRNVAQDQYLGFRNEIFRRIKNLCDRLEKTDKLLDLYEKDILSQSRQALTSAMAAYQTDQVDFVSVLLSQIQLHQNTLKFYELIREYHTAFADLENVCGQPITGN